MTIINVKKKGKNVKMDVDLTSVTKAYILQANDISKKRYTDAIASGNIDHAIDRAWSAVGYPAGYSKYDWLKMHQTKRKPIKQSCKKIKVRGYKVKPHTRCAPKNKKVKK